MDHLTDGFGRLSTSAREWTPQSAAAAATTTTTTPPQQKSERSPSIDSELNAASVKEFVPGQGWINTSATTSSTATATSSATTSSSTINNYYDRDQQHQQQQEEDILPQEEEELIDAVLPAGPTCPSTFRSLHSLAMSDDLWQFHRDASLQTLRQMDPSDPRHKAVPLPYSNAYCLDDSRSQTFGFVCQTFQVTNRNDGQLYCLRRYEGVPKNILPSPRAIQQLLEDWSSLEHANLVPIQNCFLAHRAVFFVHCWIPNACSVLKYYASTSTGAATAASPPVNERLIWSALCQLVAVLRRIHSSPVVNNNNNNNNNNNRSRNGTCGCALSKSLTLRQILIQTNLTKVSFYVNSCGIADALYDSSNNSNNNTNSNARNSNNNNSQSSPAFYEDDIRQLGRVILGMAAGGTELSPQTDATTFQNCERYCSQTYSRELHNLTMTLIRSPQAPSIVDVSRALAGRVWDEWDHVQLTLHRTERALAAEYESGRALRLLLKLGFVNERPEFGPNRRWQQSGDCYVLTLFRDYVFHQADGAGNPVMDLGHVVTALNKLDAADEEKIVLSSRDGKSLMVVSYADVARCLDSAYHELCAGSVPPPSAHHHHPRPY